MVWSCEQTEECLEAKILGKPLDSQRVAALEEHIAGCDICRVKWTTQMQLEEKLHQDFQHVLESLESPRRAVLAALAQDSQRTTKVAPSPWRTLLWLVVFLLLLFPLLFFGLTAALHLQQKKQAMESYRGLLQDSNCTIL